MALPEDILTKLLNQIVEEEKIDDANIKILPITTEGANYTSTLFTVSISSPNTKELKLFAKVATLGDAIRVQMQADKMFEMEAHIYIDLSKRYNEIQEKYGVPEEDRFRFPKYYGSVRISKEETIVLEDLAAQGFTMFDRFKTVNWEYAAKGMEELAKLHALWYSYTYEYPEEYENNSTRYNFAEFVVEDMEPFKAMCAPAIAASPDDLRPRVQQFVDSQMDVEVMKKYYSYGKYKALVHGDYRNSNIMFKRQAGKVKSLVPVDYQTMRYGSPATDLHYFIFSGTDKQFRKLHLKNLIDHYYNHFKRFMRLLNLDADQFYSRANFDDDYKESLPYGLFTAICLLPIVLVESANAPVISGEGVTVASFAVKTTESFTIRFKDILDDFIKWGVL